MIFEEKVEQFDELFRDIYKTETLETISEGEQSLKIDFKTLNKFDNELAEDLIEEPEDTISAAEKALEEISWVEHQLTPRFSNLPESENVRIRNLRSEHLGNFVPVEGIIKRASEVRPEVVSATFRCQNCEKEIEKEQDSSKLKSPYKCDCGSRKFKLVSKNMIDVQIVSIEESPEELAGTGQPSKISAYLRGDLVDPDFQKRVVPGNKVRLIGTLKEAPKKKDSKRYDIFMECNFLETIEREFEEIEITPEVEEEIEDIANSEDVLEKIVDSIAPSIYGHRNIKKALALQLFSGVRKVRDDGTVSRGDMHILLIGEPGTGKSMLLKFIGNLAPKGRYVVGKSATGAGVTASVVKDEMMEGFTLEAGALVLANRGLAGIDEIDKMSDEDKSSLHEAMEQQTITVSKANIQATLQARTSILAAGNPKFGRFDPYKPTAEQINISDSLLSRFDLIFPVKDVPDPDKDEKMAGHILRMHKEPGQDRAEIEPELLRKYIAYAKRNVEPELTEEAEEEIKQFYVGLRKKSSENKEERSIPISPRQLEGIIRMSEAYAKARLSEEIEREDAKGGIDLLTHCLKQVGVDPETGEFDIDRIESGMTSSQRGKIRSVMKIIDSLSSEVGKAVPTEDVIAEAEAEGISDVENIITKLKREGEIFEPKTGHLQKI